MNNNKILPQDQDIEAAILGAILIEGNSFINISSSLKASDFYNLNHQIVYQAIENLSKNDRPIDMLTVCDELKSMGKLDEIGGYYFVTTLSSKVALASHIEYHALIIKDLSIKRNVIKACFEVSNLAYDPNIDSQDLLTKINSNFEAIFNFSDSGVKKLSECVKLVHDDIVKNQNEIHEIEGFIPDINSLNEIIHEWEPGRLIIIAGRPGMGKTAYAIHESINAAKQFKNVLFFSLEMSYNQMTKRIMMIDDNINRHYFNVNNLTSNQWSKIDNRIAEISNYNYWIDDSTFSLNGIKNTCKLMNKKFGIDAIFIDYLQLIEGDRSLVREQQVAQITRSLKLLSKELNCPLFLLAQLNRESEQRRTEGYKPKLSDLRESGAIEQDADIVIFPHRACYYEEGNDSAWLIIAKQRDGKTGNAEIRINETVTKFTDAYESESSYFKEKESVF